MATVHPRFWCRILGHKSQFIFLFGQKKNNKTVCIGNEQWKARLNKSFAQRKKVSLPVPSSEGAVFVKDATGRVLVLERHQHGAELVQQVQQLRAPHVLQVHDLFQVVLASKVTTQPVDKKTWKNLKKRQAFCFSSNDWRWVFHKRMMDARNF